MNQKITCPCGKNIHVEGDFAYDKGKCPRCGRMLQLRPAAPASRSSRPARHAPLGILLASITAGVCALVAVPALILALTLRAQNAQLAEQLQAVQATQSSPPARVAQSSRETSQSGVTTDPAQLAQLRDQLRQLGQRVDALARNKPTTAPATPDPIRGNSGTSLEAALIRVAQGASPAVVSIETERGTGSGVVISANGYILTNDHVVGGRQRIVVHFPSGNRFNARILAKDAISDIALIKVQAANLPFLSFGDSDKLRLGQVVLALGNPFGLSLDGKPTITLGIVSALHRIVTPGSGQRRYGDAIQTDAAINPGNSGGALVDIQGRLIGINGAISSSTGTSAGVGFAIPINFVKRVLPTLKQGRSTEPGYLGVNVRDMAPEEKRGTQLRGTVVFQVTSGSPAARAGLRAGDLITHFQGQPVTSSTVLINRISYYQAGAQVTLQVVTQRHGSRTLKMTIARRATIYQPRRPRR